MDKLSKKYAGMLKGKDDKLLRNPDAIALDIVGDSNSGGGNHQKKGFWKK